jgi:hypothetical protein
MKRLDINKRESGSRKSLLFCMAEAVLKCGSVQRLGDMRELDRHADALGAAKLTITALPGKVDEINGRGENNPTLAGATGLRLDPGDARSPR